MKRLLILVLSLTLLVTPTLSLGETAESPFPDNSAEIRKNVKAYLDEMDYSYTYDSENQMFDLIFTMENQLGDVEFIVYVLENGLSCAGFPEIVVPQENRDKAAQYIVRVNYDMRYARLDMDWETGEVNSFVSIPSFDVIPSQTEIDSLLMFAYSVLEEYGDGLKRVAELGADPEAAYVEASME